ncbi:MAG: hypothetical protein ACREB8_14595 [Pseudolabrys sp.]
MMNELEIFTEVASTQIFVYLSLVFALAYAAWAVWLVGRPATPRMPASIVRRAL